jgi:hypothetical protein
MGSLLDDIDDVFNDGDNFAVLFDSIINCVKTINDCSSIKEHNKACKLLVNTLGKHVLDIHNKELFDLNIYKNIYKHPIFKTCASGRLKSLTKSVLVYSPPRGSRGAIIHILNAVKNYNNIKIEASGFCCELGDYFFDVYDGTVAFDITDNALIIHFLIKQLKIFQW